MAAQVTQAALAANEPRAGPRAAPSVTSARDVLDDRAIAVPSLRLDQLERGVGEGRVVAPGGRHLILASSRPCGSGPGPRHTSSRAVTAWPFFDLNAVYGTSATQASETQARSWSSQMARVPGGCSASGAMTAIAALTLGSIGIVAEKGRARPRDRGAFICFEEQQPGAEAAGGRSWARRGVWPIVRCAAWAVGGSASPGWPATGPEPARTCSACCAPTTVAMARRGQGVHLAGLPGPDNRHLPAAGRPAGVVLGAGQPQRPGLAPELISGLRRNLVAAQTSHGELRRRRPGGPGLHH